MPDDCDHPIECHDDVGNCQWCAELRSLALEVAALKKKLAVAEGYVPGFEDQRGKTVVEYASVDTILGPAETEHVTTPESMTDKEEETISAAALARLIAQHERVLESIDALTRAVRTVADQSEREQAT